MKPAAGPFLFETAALGYLARAAEKGAARWFRKYCDLFPVYVSAATVTEQLRGYALLLERAAPHRRTDIEAARDRYLERLASCAVTVVPFNARTAMLAAQLTVLVPFAPHPPYRAAGLVESRPDRLARWRAQVQIAATALGCGMRLIHDNARDYESIRDLVKEFPARFPGVGAPEFLRARSLAG